MVDNGWRWMEVGEVVGGGWKWVEVVEKGWSWGMLEVDESALRWLEVGGVG